jgi:hypothetical protein
MRTQILLKQTAIFLLCFVFSSLLVTIKLHAQIKQQQQADNSDTVSANKFLCTNASYKIKDA